MITIKSPREIELLKILNFKAENDIKQVNNMIFKITNDYNYLKVCMKYLSIDEKENLCLQPKYYPFISKILSKQINNSFSGVKTIKKIEDKENKENKNKMVSSPIKIMGYNSKSILG